jgi:hypothetical protein
MAGDQEPLDLRDEDAIDLGYATDFHILLRAIDEAMPSDAILCLEGYATVPAVRGFLRRHAASDPRELVPNSNRPGETFHLPLSDGNLRELRTIAEDHVRFEVASHLAVYRGDEVLLWAHDAGDSSIQLATSLPDETIERFRDALGTSLRRPKRRTWLWSRPRDD